MWPGLLCSSDASLSFCDGRLWRLLLSSPLRGDRAADEDEAVGSVGGIAGVADEEEIEPGRRRDEDAVGS